MSFKPCNGFPSHSEYNSKSLLLFFQLAHCGPLWGKNSLPPKDTYMLTPRDCECYHRWQKKKKGLCRYFEVMDFEMCRFSWIIWVSPKCNQPRLLIRGKQSEILHTWRRRRYEGRVERDLKMLVYKTEVMQSSAKDCRQPPKAESGKEKILPQSLRRECGPADTLTNCSRLSMD